MKKICLFIPVLFIVSILVSYSEAKFMEIDANEEFQRATKAARVHGIDAAFIEKIINSGKGKFVSRVVRINTTNYAKPPDYSSHYNKMSVREVRRFIKANKKILKTAQKKTTVRKEIIASILWIESRCGQITGNYNVVSVFLSLLLASDTMYVRQSLAGVIEGQALDSFQLDSVRSLILRRAKQKVAWAVEELRALSNIDKRRVIDVISLHGSWAGAFGYAQFLPSSYQRWAVDGDADGDIDLYSIPDAVFSIGNYLKSNGWGKVRSKQRRAVHHYNNSDAYVKAVFTLARRVR